MEYESCSNRNPGSHAMLYTACHILTMPEILPVYENRKSEFKIRNSALNGDF